MWGGGVCVGVCVGGGGGGGGGGGRASLYGSAHDDHVREIAFETSSPKGNDRSPESHYTCCKFALKQLRGLSKKFVD